MTMVRRRLRVNTPVTTGLNAGGYAIRVDNYNNVYVADNGNYRISRTNDAGGLYPVVDMSTRGVYRMDISNDYFFFNYYFHNVTVLVCIYQKSRWEDLSSFRTTQ